MMSIRELILLLIQLSFISGLALGDCPDRFFNCTNGQCIGIIYRCDGDNDCGNGFDELDCDIDHYESSLIEPLGCPKYFLSCNDSAKDTCIPDKWKCDGHTDCPNEADERHCLEVPEKCRGYSCRNLQCIPWALRCDGVEDCYDQSDEFECSSYKFSGVPSLTTWPSSTILLALVLASKFV